MRKLLSLFVALIMVLSFATVVSAATEDKKAELSFDANWDAEQECYVLTAYLNLDGGLDIAKKSNRYTGSGLYSFMVTFNGVTVDDFAYGGDEYYGDPAIDYAGPNLGDGFLTFGGQCSGKASGLYASEAPVELFYLYVNGDSEEAVEAKFSNLGYSAFKVATVDNVLGTYSIPGADITTYAVGDDGATKHVDADYVLTTPLNKGGSDDEEEGSDILDKVAPEAKTAEATYQIGTGVGMTVTAPEGVAFTKMIWAITKGAERVYSDKVDFPFAVSGDVRVAATFVNGTHNGNYNAEVKESYEIGEEDFDAIFYGVNAENTEEYVRDYFTNEADADNKEEKAE